MDRKLLPVGIDDYKKLIDEDYYYVDKTLLIKDLINNLAFVNLFTRPRRFGKTLNLSMAEAKNLLMEAVIHIYLKIKKS